MRKSSLDLVTVVEGVKVELQRAELSKKSRTVLVPEDQLGHIPSQDIISVMDPDEKDLPPPDTFPDQPVKSEDESDDQYAQKVASWEEGKSAWEEQQAKKPALKKVNLWEHIYHVVQARVDGHLLKIFHTVRGPVIGLVVSEDSNRVTLYSPAYLDPNLQRDRVHYLPIAFAGYQYTLHKPNVGESVPDQAVCLGYPRFLRENQNGDYVYKGKGAYHHVEARMENEDAPPASAEVGLRASLAGAVPTSAVQQVKEVVQARALQALHQAKQQTQE